MFYCRCNEKAFGITENVGILDGQYFRLRQYADWTGTPECGFKFTRLALSVSSNALVYRQMDHSNAIKNFYDNNVTFEWKRLEEHFIE